MKRYKSIESINMKAEIGEKENADAQKPAKKRKLGTKKKD